MTNFWHRWIPKIFYKKYDGGPDSGVTGYFLIEWKALFSIGILHFKKGSREAFHSHAFNAITWWLKGKVTEEKFLGQNADFSPSLKPKITMRDNVHKVYAHEDTYALTFRGPWKDEWIECRPSKEMNGSYDVVVLTHGRKVLDFKLDSEACK